MSWRVQSRDRASANQLVQGARALSEAHVGGAPPASILFHGAEWEAHQQHALVRGDHHHPDAPSPSPLQTHLPPPVPPGALTFPAVARPGRHSRLRGSPGSTSSSSRVAAPDRLASTCIKLARASRRHMPTAAMAACSKRPACDLILMLGPPRGVGLELSAGQAAKYPSPAPAASALPTRHALLPLPRLCVANPREGYSAALQQGRA